MEDIIKNDSTLNYIINEAKLDIFNQNQIDIRICAIKLALFKLIDKNYNNL